MADTDDSKSEATPKMEVMAQNFTVNVSRVEEMIAKLQKLAARAQRLGVGVFAWEVGPERLQEYEHEDRDTGKVEKRQMLVQDVVVVGQTPRYQGWTFLAKLDHEEGGNLVHVMKSQVLPDQYKNLAPYCIHCNSKRKRTSTFMLQSDDGKVVQVGSSCLRDFLGHGNPAAWADYATLMDQLWEEGWAAARGGPQEADEAFALEPYLWFVFEAVKELGFVASKGGEKGEPATWKVASQTCSEWLKANKDPKKEPKAEIKSEVAEALAWIRSATPDSDYIANLQVAAKGTYVTRKTRGLLASLPKAWQHHLESGNRQKFDGKFQPSRNFVGTIGEKMLLELRFERTVRYRVPSYGYGRGETFNYMHIFRDKDDNAVVWKTGSWRIPAPEQRDGVWFKSSLPHDPVPGEEIVLECTIKDHSFYRDENQTIVTRCDCVLPKVPKKSKSGLSKLDKAIAVAEEKYEKALTKYLDKGAFNVTTNEKNRKMFYEADDALSALEAARHAKELGLSDSTPEVQRYLEAYAAARSTMRSYHLFMERNRKDNGMVEYDTVPMHFDDDPRGLHRIPTDVDWQVTSEDVAEADAAKHSDAHRNAENAMHEAFKALSLETTKAAPKTTLADKLVAAHDKMEKARTRPDLEAFRRAEAAYEKLAQKVARTEYEQHGGEEVMRAEARWREAERAWDKFMQMNDNDERGSYYDMGYGDVGYTIMYPVGGGAWTGADKHRGEAYRDKIKKELLEAKQALDEARAKYAHER